MDRKLVIKAFYFFIEKAVELLEKDGLLIYLTTNYWLRADGGIILRETLKTNGLVNEAQEMSKKVFASSSYEEALQIITEYVEPIDVNESLDEQDLYDDFDLEIE